MSVSCRKVFIRNIHNIYSMIKDNALQKYKVNKLFIKQLKQDRYEKINC